MSAGLVRLLGSSKAWVVGLAVIGMVVLGALGKLPMGEVKDTIVLLVMTLVGANTAEDVATKLKMKPGDSRPASIAPRKPGS